MAANEPLKSQITKPIETQAVANQRLWTSNFILICLSNISIYLVFHGLLPTLPIYIENLGGSISMAGLAFAFLTIAAVISRPFTGWALDNYGRKIILAAGLLIFFVPTLLFTFMVGIVPLLILRLIQGFGWGICNTSQGTVASDIIPREHFGKGLGIYGMTMSISVASAPGLSLWIIDTFSFEVLFITMSLLTLTSLAFAMTIKYPKQTPPPTKTKLVFFEKLALRPSIVILLVFISYSAVPTFLALFVRQIGLSTAGIFFTATAISALISRPITGTLIDRKGRRGYDIVAFSGLLIMLWSMIMIPRISSSWYLVLIGAILGLGFGSLQPAMLALSISSVPDERRGAANATFWTAVDIGIALGSVLWGIIANYFGYALMFYMTAIPLIFALLIYWFSRKQIPAKV